MGEKMGRAGSDQGRVGGAGYGRDGTPGEGRRITCK
jgi:hypothetical protein